MTEMEMNVRGTGIDYDPLWTLKGPMEKDRKPTDVKFLKIFQSFLILWLLVAVLAATRSAYLERTDDYSFLPAYLVNAFKFHKNDAPDNLFDDEEIKAIDIVWITIVVSVVLSNAYIVLLRWFASIIVYTAIASFFGVLFVSTCLIGSLYAEQKDEIVLAIFMFFVVVFVTSLLLFVMHRKKVQLSCLAIQEASKCIAFFPSTILFPLLAGCLYLVVVGFSIFVAVNLESMKEEYGVRPSFVEFLHSFNLFGVLWLGSFVTGFLHMTLAGTFATWFWTHKKEYIPRFTILHFMDRIARNHLGTLAFGSMIMILCYVIRFTLKLVKKLFETYNPCACYCSGVYDHLCGDVEKFVKYINRNAYIMCAVHGSDFVTSAKDAFNLLMRNILNVFVSHKVTNGVLFLGQILVIKITLLLCYVPFVDDYENKDVLGIVLVTAAVTTYFSFMVIRAAIETIFHCVLEDFERNDGSNEKPYFMSSKLKSVFFNQ